MSILLYKKLDAQKLSAARVPISQVEHFLTENTSCYECLTNNDMPECDAPPKIIVACEELRQRIIFA